MKSSRRLFALVAAFAVAFGALWPLVSQARFGPPQIPSVICTQSGFQHPGLPADHDDKSHCPLCVMSVDTTLPAVAAQSPPPLASAISEPRPPVAALHSLLLARPPPSRAPPKHS